MMPALLNHLWQSSLVAAMAALLAWRLRRHSARLRFWIWMFASLKFLLPFSVLAAAGGWLFRHSHAAPAALPPPALAIVARPFAAPAPIFVAPLPGGPIVPAPPNWHLWLWAGIWIGGSLIVLARWWRNHREVSRLCRGASRSSLPGFDGPVGLVDAAIEPGVFGIWHPELLLPHGLVETLRPDQLAAIAAHENWHVRRRDNLWSALQMLVASVFWFYPLVGWLGARQLEERERACDEAVLGEGAEREVYASSVLTVCRRFNHFAPACMAGVGGGPLERRIRAILHGTVTGDPSPRVRLGWTAAAALLLLAPLALGMPYLRQAPPAARTFDAVSIRPAPTSGPFCLGCMVPSRQDPKTMVLQGFTLHALVCLAYVEDQNSCGYRIASKGPSWTDTVRWEIDARTDAPASTREKLQMLQQVLASRFHLELRRETRSTTAYALRLAGKAPKMPAATDLSKCGEDFTPDMQHFTAGCVTMEDVTELVGMIIKDRPVVNQTGIGPDRKFQLKLEAAAPDQVDAAVPSVFAALPDQLGLKLTASKTPVDVLVILGATRPGIN